VREWVVVLVSNMCICIYEKKILEIMKQGESWLIKYIYCWVVHKKKLHWFLKKGMLNLGIRGVCVWSNRPKRDSCRFCFGQIKSVWVVIHVNMILGVFLSAIFDSLIIYASNVAVDTWNLYWVAPKSKKKRFTDLKIQRMRENGH